MAGNKPKPIARQAATQMHLYGYASAAKIYDAKIAEMQAALFLALKALPSPSAKSGKFFDVRAKIIDAIKDTE